MARWTRTETDTRPLPVGAEVDLDTVALFDTISRARGHRSRSVTLREAIDEYIDTHGHEAGLVPQEALFDAAG
ncbi:putative transcriptional regulator [Naumannella cuiyingiana]|uniref:Putative transcriptional regulator n=1 Tax=Naumannella cuiyingiana TaxID=1347891 RepID=A0A7Z0IMK4_9ACTN|nr:ribbon-helix-helix protein, CopG family [Naumannella cuiyingiana]NYI72711.1 putative transcriptional regulator [Naumannella cuiyingiana]